MNVTTGLAELRNRGYGTGHGPTGERVGLHPRHTHLAVDTAMTWCISKSLQRSAGMSGCDGSAFVLGATQPIVIYSWAPMVYGM
jgi:hypothetical protein